ncbi:hypothetical protein D1AOALGA4SA_3327 [Olavius algarvensis Delta 1 endosymbiont]|nr:hypothetical protein D1AOALGA4SA_3327 [Olavius algarvensis Delta 1 endosymbiont]
MFNYFCIFMKIPRYYAIFDTAIGKSGPSGAAIAQFIGFRFQVSGAGCQ